MNAVKTVVTGLVAINFITIVPTEFNNGETSFLVVSSDVAGSADEADSAVEVNTDTIGDDGDTFASFVGKGVMFVTSNADVFFASTARFLVGTTVGNFEQTALFVVGENVAVDALVAVASFGVNVAVLNFRHAFVTLGAEAGEIAVAFDAKVVAVVVDAVVDASDDALGPVAGLGIPFLTNGAKSGAVEVTVAVGDRLQALVVDQNVIFLAL